MGTTRHPSRSPRERGFTLIELVIVLGMLVVVLSVTYRIILDCMTADRLIDRLTVPEKVGEGVMALVRTDLAGLMYRHMGRRVFFVTDNGLPPNAHDEIRFLTTVEPTPIEESGVSDTVAIIERRGIQGIVYFLQPSHNEEGVPSFTLFRKEITELRPEGPLEGPGMVFEVFDKVAYLNVECFDGWSWYQDWDSELRIQQEEADLQAAAEAGQGRIARVSDPQSLTVPGLTTPGVDPYSEDPYGAAPPPAAVPVAIRVELGIYVAPGGQFLRDQDQIPVVKTYSTIVPVLVAQRLPMELEDLTLGSEDLAAETGGRGGDAEGGPQTVWGLAGGAGGREGGPSVRGARPGGGRGGRPERVPLLSPRTRGPTRPGGDRPSLPPGLPSGLPTGGRGGGPSGLAPRR